MKTPVLESLFNKVTDLKACRCFPVNIAKILKTAGFIEYLWWLLLKIVEALKTQNKTNGTAATISTIYMRFLNNLFIFGVLTSVLNFSSTFSKRRIFLVFVWQFYKNNLIFQKDYLTSWQVHEPNNNQDNIYFRCHFFLYVENSQVLTIILKKQDF